MTDLQPYSLPFRGPGLCFVFFNRACCYGLRYIHYLWYLVVQFSYVPLRSLCASCVWVFHCLTYNWPFLLRRQDLATFRHVWNFGGPTVKIRKGGVTCQVGVDCHGQPLFDSYGDGIPRDPQNMGNGHPCDLHGRTKPGQDIDVRVAVRWVVVLSRCIHLAPLEPQSFS